MNIEELRAAAEQELAGELNEYATLEFAHEAARALPALLAVVEAAEQRNDCALGMRGCSICRGNLEAAITALRHLSEKGTDDADKGSN